MTGAKPAKPIPCLCCRYDLTGLPESGPCPECGAPAIISMLGSAFYLMPIRKLCRIRFGARTIMVGTVALPVLWAFARLQDDWDLKTSMTYHILTAAFIFGLLAVGSFPLTTNLRALARFTPRFDIADIATRIAGIALIVLTIWMIQSDPYGERTEKPWGLAVAIALTVFCLTAMFHIRHIARIMPSKQLSRDCSAALVFLPLAIFASLFFAASLGGFVLAIPFMILGWLCASLSRHITHHLADRQEQTTRRGIPIDGWAVFRASRAFQTRA